MELMEKAGKSVEDMAEQLDLDDQILRINGQKRDDPVPAKRSRFDSSATASSPSPSNPSVPGSPLVDEDVYIEEEQEDEELKIIQEKRFEDLTEEEKQKLSEDVLKEKEDAYQERLISRLPVYYPGIRGCRNVGEYKLLNKISEGTYGVVYRAKENRTDTVVALKGLKMEKEKEGFPITSLREINMLMKCRSHPNIVGLKEIVIGDTMDSIFLVMEFVEHDVKALMDQLHGKKKKFTVPQIKVLMQQLIDGICYMHSEWVIHRDLKTSNLLLSHKNVLKIGDFGLAREFGDPLKPYTPVVVTLWYRSPELLLGTKYYSTAVDVWSIGCIFGEFITLKPMFQGCSEADQVKKIFAVTGAPSEDPNEPQYWSNYRDLPHGKHEWAGCKTNQLSANYLKLIKSPTGVDLMNKLLTLDPKERISAEKALKHPFFTEDPLPASLDSFPSWPAKSENHKAPPPKKTVKDLAPAVPLDPKQRKLLDEFKVDQKHYKEFSLKF